MNNLIIHIPHSSLEIPKEFYTQTLIPSDMIQTENLFMCDYLVDTFVPQNINNVIKFGCSRMFCDVERFRDDSVEPMSKYGMGVVYERGSNGKRFLLPDKHYKQYILTQYYDKHHEELNMSAEKALRDNEFCYILDLHSFSDEFVNKLLDIKETPDICIGFDLKFADAEWMRFTKKYFELLGFSVAFNTPYSGSMVPSRYMTDNRIKSLMIEINKRLYLNNNTEIKQDKYVLLKKALHRYIDLINNSLNC